MIKNIYPLPCLSNCTEHCDHCKRKCDISAKEPYIVTSTVIGMKSMLICKACLDLALNEYKILPEEF